MALVAGSEIADPNDYIVRNALGRSVLITRDEDGVAHAFLNYCRHRGAEPAHGCGNARRFTCPYHAWVYDTRGQLVGMPMRDRHDGFDLSPYSLVELPSEERHGFVWVVIRRGHPIDVAAHLGELDAEIAIARLRQDELLPLAGRSAVGGQLEVGGRRRDRRAARSPRPCGHLQPEPASLQHRPGLLRRRRRACPLGHADVRARGGPPAASHP